MKCFNCGKEMDREDGGMTLRGIDVSVKAGTDAGNGPKDIEYRNKQLGKYSDGNGECHVGLCYECYIDGLFNVGVWVKQ